MGSLRVLIRLAAYLFFFAFLGAALGAAFGLKGLCFGALLLVLFGVLILFFSEKSWIHKFHAQTLPAESGVDPGTLAGRVKVFADPYPRIWVIRSAFSRGTVLVSQGLLASASSQEIASILSLCESRLHHQGLALVTASALINEWLHAWVPGAWLEWVCDRAGSREALPPLKASNAVFICLLTPIVGFFLWQQRGMAWLTTTRGGQSLSGLQKPAEPLSGIGLSLKLALPRA